MAVKVFPYKAGSKSAKDLATALGAKRLKHQGSTWRPREGDLVINWGFSMHLPLQYLENIVNDPSTVAITINKLTAFQLWKDSEIDVPIPQFWTDKEEAIAWMRGKASRKVVARTKLRSYGGDGIVIANTPDELVDAPLYVAYIPKQEEYRVHVMNGEVFFAQRKARKLDVPDADVNWQVRNLAGGFIYANQDVQVPDAVSQAALQAIQASSLDFGAVDVVTTASGKVYVLEINTACGLAGTTLEKYAEAFKKHYIQS